MPAESPTVGIWKTCKVCTETLRDTLSSGTNLSSMSAMVTDLQTHETPEGLLTCPVDDMGKLAGKQRKATCLRYPSEDADPGDMLQLKIKIECCRIM